MSKYQAPKKRQVTFCQIIWEELQVKELGKIKKLAAMCSSGGNHNSAVGSRLGKIEHTNFNLLPIHLLMYCPEARQFFSNTYLKPIFWELLEMREGFGNVGCGFKVLILHLVQILNNSVWYYTIKLLCHQPVCKSFSFIFCKHKLYFGFYICCSCYFHHSTQTYYHQVKYQVLQHKLQKASYCQDTV